MKNRRGQVWEALGKLYLVVEPGKKVSVRTFSHAVLCLETGKRQEMYEAIHKPWDDNFRLA